jgi:hypothetical protein
MAMRFADSLALLLQWSEREPIKDRIRALKVALQDLELADLQQTYETEARRYGEALEEAGRP